ncbi:MAG: hypothetical protein CMK59_13910 [Proteobacteria bacterium]|nr:hypothetical protein [Pseudomonadota bacterium]
MIYLFISCDSTTYDYVQISGKADSPQEVWEGEAETEYQFECSDVSWGDRFSDESSVRGFTENVPDLQDICPFCNPIGLGLVAEDFNRDGAIDLVVGHLLSPPLLYLNDGQGFFTSEALNGVVPDVFHIPEKDRGIRSLAAGDLNGDGWIDLIWGGVGLVGWYQNQQGRFLPLEILYTDSETQLGVYGNIQVGDLNGDDLLDVFAATTRATGCPSCPELDPQEGDALGLWPDLTLIQHSDGFEAQFLRTDEIGSNSHIGVAVDLDLDGQLEIYVPKDLEGKSAFWEWLNGHWNDFVEDRGLELNCKAMGFSVAELNADQELDFCMTCLGPPLCMLSDGYGGFYDASRMLGFSIESYQSVDPPVGWSGHFADLNNDGWLDFVQASGASDSEEQQYDLIWAADRMGGFSEVSFVAGIEDSRDHYGLVTADFDSDGYLDIVTTGPGHPPVFYKNKGGNCGWVQLLSSKKHTTIEVEIGEQRLIQQILGATGQAQNPSLFHFGLGEANKTGPVWRQELGMSEAERIRMSVYGGNRIFIEEQ